MNRHIGTNTICLTPSPFIEVLLPRQEHVWSAICVLGGIDYFSVVLFDIVFKELFIQCGISFFLF
jgi:hypothetical protein